MVAMGEATARLDYGRRMRPRRRVWRAGALLAVVALVGAAVLWGPGWLRHAADLLDQRRCMNYTAPPDQVVYDTPRDVQGVRRSLKTSFAPSSWKRFARNRGAAVVFLHGRTSPSGNRRLVCVEADPKSVLHYAGSASVMPTWSFRVLVPGTLSKGPADVPGTVYKEPFFLISAERVYAAQPDPSDPSHFTITYEHHGERKTVDAWLQDDDTLKFRHRQMGDQDPAGRW